MFERTFARRIALLLAAGSLAVAASACGDDNGNSTSEATTAAQAAESSAAGSTDAGSSDTAAVATTVAAAQSADLSSLSGKVAIDGSSTVAPISSAVAEDFSKEAGGVEVTVGTSGTGGGFEKFCAGETDISDASRPIEDDEKKACANNGVEYLELPVARDALTVAVNADNDWATCLTTDELEKIWNEGSTISKWNEVRPEFPDEDLTLYGPGTDSGTFDYFTGAINGEEGASRTDYTASEDDNVLVQGVGGDPGALGYFGLAYYEENADTLKAVEIDSGAGCVAPGAETVLDGTYTPLSRPLFIYVSKASAARPEVRTFVQYYLDQAPALVEQVQYIPNDQAAYDEDKAKLAQFAGA
jgi:phosphate transport system substrate-binding protein